MTVLYYFTVRALSDLPSKFDSRVIDTPTLQNSAINISDYMVQKNHQAKINGHLKYCLLKQQYY